ncbi:hypothetical protein [Roseovarius salinarum]|uniref:hypothetical protein n=1 Tax=Roseovarius salinarum TaxID=1981892 RepID=UPI0012FFE253|nr:hypothetical protein [Roseovarius salinarum]
MIHAVVIVLFVIFTATLIGKIMRHFFPDSGIGMDKDTTTETDTEAKVPAE